MYVRALTVNRIAVRNGMQDIHSILDHLLADEILTTAQNDTICNEATPADRIRRLIDTLIKLENKPEVFASFCRALDQENYNDIATKLRLDFKRFSKEHVEEINKSVTDDDVYAKALSESRTLIKYQLSDGILNDVLDQLRAKGILAEDQYNEIRSKRTPIERKRRLMDILIKHYKIKVTFNEFCEALKIVKHSEIAEYLKENFKNFSVNRVEVASRFNVIDPRDKG